MGFHDFEPDDDEIEYAELEDCYVKHETEGALLVMYEGSDHWIPRSQVEGGEDIHKFYRGTLMVTAWFAEKEGIV